MGSVVPEEGLEKFAEVEQRISTLLKADDNFFIIQQNGLIQLSFRVNHWLWGKFDNPFH